MIRDVNIKSMRFMSSAKPAQPHIVPRLGGMEVREEFFEVEIEGTVTTRCEVCKKGRPRVDKIRTNIFIPGWIFLHKRIIDGIIDKWFEMVRKGT